MAIAAQATANFCNTMRHRSVLVFASIASTSAWAPALGVSRSSGDSIWRSTATPTIAPNTRTITTSLKAATASMPPLTSHFEEHLPLAREAMQFIDDSPDPFHVIQTTSRALEKVGFEEWKDDDDSILEPGGKYYFTSNKSTLVAFTVGKKYQPGKGFKIIGSHTDSPNLKVKPRSKRTTAKNGGVSGAIQLGVECYGGGLWHTWFDRDLGISGRVFINDESTGRIRQVSYRRYWDRIFLFLLEY